MDRMKRTVIVLGASADIGKNMCKYYLRDNFSVLGTYRHPSKNIKELSGLEGMSLFQCDVTCKEDVESLSRYVQENNFHWRTLFSSVGTSEPIGRFFTLDFDDWNDSVQVNCIGQLRALHALYPYRNTEEGIPNVVLLAGGGTNNAFRCYSAYCVAKVLLIKMCELLDDENIDLNTFIVGPGFVRTKTHLETLNAGALAESNLNRVQQFWESGDKGTSMEDIYDCIRWLETQGREVTGGRNISVVHDQWGKETLAEELKKNPDMYKLRRFGNNWK